MLHRRVIVVACIVMALVVLTHVVVASIGMTYIVMTSVALLACFIVVFARNPETQVPSLWMRWLGYRTAKVHSTDESAPDESPGRFYAVRACCACELCVRAVIRVCVLLCMRACLRAIVDVCVLWCVPSV